MIPSKVELGCIAYNSERPVLLWEHTHTPMAVGCDKCLISVWKDAHNFIIVSKRTRQ